LPSSTGSLSDSFVKPNWFASKPLYKCA
jgi:hypothetical protein